MLDMIVEVMEAIFRWFVNLLASGAQFLAGVIFNTMNDFMGSDQNIIIDTLKPVYNFSVYYLKPISLALLGVILVWSLISTMFGKFSTSKDEPMTLFARAIIFSILIAASTQLINVIGGTAQLSNGSTVPGVVLQMTSAMADIGTKNDSYGDSKLKVSKNVYEKMNTVLSGAESSVDEFTGYDALSTNGIDNPTGDENNIANSTYKNKNTKNVGYILTNKGNNNAFATYIISLLIYLIVYAFMLLWIAWQCLKVCSRFVYRFIIFLVILYMAPLAFACGPSKGTQKIFGEWVKMIISYALLLILTAGFMRVSTYVIYAGFYYAAIDSSLIKVVVSFLTILMFLKMIFDLEKYIEKLGLTAVGLPDSVSGFTGFARESAKNALKDNMRADRRKIEDFIKTPSLTTNTSSAITDNTIREAFEQGEPNINSDTNKDINALSQEMMNSGKNDNSFIEDPTGNYAQGTDGLMHELGENGEAIDGSEISSGQRFDLADSNNSMVASEVDGMDDSSSYTSITDTDKDSALVEDSNGDYLMAMASKTNDFGNEVNDGVAIPKSSLETDENGDVQKFSMNMNDDGNMSYSLDKNGEFAMVKGENGGLVNVGKDEKSYSQGKEGHLYAVNQQTGRVDDVSNYYNSNGELTVSNPTQQKEFEAKYGKNPLAETQKVKYRTGGNGSKNISAKTGRYVEAAAYNSNLPSGARISAVNKLEYCDTLEKQADGTRKGIALQHLENGDSKYVKFSVYDVNELTKDEISKHRRNCMNNPCEGYTPDGNKYIHIEKYLAEKDRKIKPRKSAL